jgi:hypothetical protein
MTLRLAHLRTNRSPSALERVIVQAGILLDSPGVRSHVCTRERREPDQRLIPAPIDRGHISFTPCGAARVGIVAVKSPRSNPHMRTAAGRLGLQTEVTTTVRRPDTPRSCRSLPTVPSRARTVHSVSYVRVHKLVLHATYGREAHGGTDRAADGPISTSRTIKVSRDAGYDARRTGSARKLLVIPRRCRTGQG